MQFPSAYSASSRDWLSGSQGIRILAYVQDGVLTESLSRTQVAGYELVTVSDEVGYPLSAVNGTENEPDLASSPPDSQAEPSRTPLV